MTKHDAPGQLAGYMYQLERALYWLSLGDTQLVGLEVGDDIVVHNTPESGGKETREQDKNSISRRTPFSDASHDLWNTLKIWLEAIRDQKLDAGKCTFLLVTNKPLPNTYLAVKISTAKLPAEISACVAALRKTGSEVTGELTGTVNEVLNFTDGELFALFSRIELEDKNKSSSGTDLRKRIFGNLHIFQEPLGTEVVQRLLGWAHDSVLESLRNRKPAWLMKGDFDARYQRTFARYLNEKMRITAEHLLTVTDERRTNASPNVFVDQLKLVLSDQHTDYIAEAIGDFLRSKDELTRLSKEGWTTEDDVTSFFNNLHRRWKSIFDRHQGTLSKNVPLGQETEHKRACGFNTFVETTDHREKLCGNDTEEFYLTKGSYHQLVDERKVGWHPDFKAKLKNEDDK